MPSTTAVRLFVTHLATRLAFALLVGFGHNYSLQPDSYWLIRFADQAAQGNFDFALDRFIASPLFPVVAGGSKWLFGPAWATVLALFQIGLAALSGVYLYKIGLILFNQARAALLGSLLYAIFPFTLWWVHTFSQESLFQSLFIFTFYHLVAFLRQPAWGRLAAAAGLFSLSYLTKSHVLLFSPFVPLLFLHFFGWEAKTLAYSLVFAGIAVGFSVPYGLYTHARHGTYVLSSNGATYQFYLGNTEAGYRAVVDVPPRGSAEFEQVRDINVTAGYFNGSVARYDSLLALPQRIKQPLFFQTAWHWIKQNPTKWLKMKLYDAGLFLLPGLSFQYYGFWQWLASLTLSLPVYLAAYRAMVRHLRTDYRWASPVFYLFVAMLLFSTVWYVQNRFRTVTIEPFYLLYSAWGGLPWLTKWPGAERWVIRLTAVYGLAK
ncbi:MAG: glycosyltransferase family 39 protein [Bernardetiaceae bacterium]|nr:glycosyltransferase family 39 protein [Bernardetiaceae bacterium]